jgi:hypothetical protein
MMTDICLLPCLCPPNRLELVASAYQGLQVALDLLGLAVPHLPTTLSELRRLALARAQLSEEEVSAGSK